MNNKIRNKFLMSLSVIIFILICCVLGCQNNIEMSAGNEAAVVTISEINEAQTDKPLLKLNIAENVGRSALPTVNLSDIGYIGLLYENTDDSDPSNDERFIGSWGSVDDMLQAAIPFTIGTYKFTLIAIAGDTYMSESKEYTVTTGTNELSFKLSMEIIDTTPLGKGNINVSVSVADGTVNVAKVTGGLYSLSGIALTDYEDEELTAAESKYVYTKQDVQSGSYVVIFKFYADADKTQLLGMYREYAVITNGLTSSSECTLDALGSLYHINYECNGGEWKSGFTAPGSYTRHSSNVITLPTADDISKTNCDFDGWYDNADCSGDEVTKLLRGTSGDKTFYAKWLEKATIIFNPNGGTLTKDTQSVYKNIETALTSAADLGLTVPSAKRFIGWAETANAPEPLYRDCGAVTVAEDSKTLYAVYAVTPINPTSSDDTDDADNDGLTDWDEIYTYFTNPDNPDTDGDGWNDYEEARQLYDAGRKMFNPLVADVPALQLKLTGNPSFYYRYTLTESKEKEDTQIVSNGSIGSSTDRQSNTTSREESHGWSYAHTFSEEWGIEFTFAMQEEVGYSGSIDIGDSYTYSQETMNGWTKAWSNGKSITNTESKTVTGGKVEFPIKFVNPSNIAYSVDSVTVSSNTISTRFGTSAVVSLGSVSNKDGFTLGPGVETGTIYFTIEFDDVDRMEKAMKYSNGLEVWLSSYKISTQANGKKSDFTNELTKVNAQTAKLYIDCGVGSGKKAMTYYVSAKNRLNTEAVDITNLYVKNNIKYIFDTILKMQQGIDYELSAEGYIKTIDGISANADLYKGGWYLSHKYTKNGERKGRYYPACNDDTPTEQKWSIENIEVGPGDEICIIYDIDRDHDKVSLNEELIYGTSDDNPDTDGDGLTDYEEIYGWYKPGLVSKYADTRDKRVCTNPVIVDSDGDDLFDYDCTNDMVADTDPISPKLKNDTSLGVIQYAKTAAEATENKYTDFTFNDNGTAEIDGLYEEIYLNIVPKIPVQFGSDVMYSDVSKNGPWRGISRDKGLMLNVGSNQLYIKCTAPDRTERIYTLNVNSVFRGIGVFKAESEKYEDGIVSMTWDADKKIDGRADKLYSGGYILYGVKSAKLETPTLSRSKAASAGSIPDSLKGKDDFLCALDAATVKASTLSLKLDTHTDYCLYLFAYSSSDSSSMYQYKLLGSSYVKSGVSKIGTLTFYAHYIKCTKVHDGPGSEGEYTFTFNDSCFKLNQYNKQRSDTPVDLAKDWCWGFKNGTVYHGDPAKYVDCTAAHEVEFDRTVNHEFEQHWHCTEMDNQNTNNGEYLGNVVAKFSYNSSSDTWSMSWKSTTGEDGANSIVADGEKHENIWKIYNTSDGEVELHWAWKWE
ncbi:MAG: InlB B-repeat-containing protein [Spirochaetales bacterium]|nr:InlB B-repeat-containing protein [Spirochaetales bacterium]